MVVAPKYKHYDGINFVGETRVRMKDQEAVRHTSKHLVTRASLLVARSY